MENVSLLLGNIKELFRSVEFANPLVSAVAAVIVGLAAFVLYRIVANLSARVIARVESWEGGRITSYHVQDQEILSSEEIVGLLTIIVKAIRMILLAAIVIGAIELMLGFFTWTRELAAAGLDLLVAALLDTGRAVIGYIPNLILVIVIVAIAWYLIRLARLVFNGIQSERIRLRNFYPEWAMPTFNIVRILIFIFALVMAFPYLPGAGSPAFRGVSIFVGVLFSLGSTSAVANVVAGIVITYTRAFKIGDRVRIDETEGIVVERSLFVTRLRTRRNIEIAVPNSKVLSNPIVNYSAMVRTKFLLLQTSVGIGYDVDWRRVHELMITAAKETKGIAEEPEPFVLQSELGDFAVSYELNAPINHPHKMARIVSELNANILDQFHRAGVEIMSPDFTALRRGNKPAIPVVPEKPQPDSEPPQQS